MPQTFKHVEVYFIAQSLCVILNLHVQYQKRNIVMRYLSYLNGKRKAIFMFLPFECCVQFFKTMKRNILSKNTKVKSTIWFASCSDKN